MSMLAQYTDLATPKLRSILQQLQPPQRKELLRRLGQELEVRLKKHFAQREQDSPNKQGFPRSHFWNRVVRDATALRDVSDNRATVGIASREFAHKITGGTIKPGPGRRFLALPMRAEAYGVLPRDNTIPGLFPIRSKILGKAWLATREGGALRFYFRLVPSVHQAADPRALPPIAELQRALEATADKEVQRIIEQAK